MIDTLIKKIKSIDLLAYPLLLLIVYGIFLRIQDLGYSNFQGDEVNTIDFIYNNHSSLIDYLFSQKKGPVQFLINLANIQIFGYINEFQIRFPYMLLGILAIPMWYALSAKISNKSVGLIVALLLSMHGLFISFSRITQYQSVMYFLMPVAFFAFLKVSKTPNIIWSIITGILCGLLVLTHYDGGAFFFFVLPSMLLIIRNEYDKEKKIDWKLIRSYSIVLVFAIILNSIFYIPYLFGNSTFEDSTKGYLSSRLLGGGFMPRTEITIKLLSMYIPSAFLYGFFILSILGIFISHYKFLKRKALIVTFGLLNLLLLLSTWFSLYPLKPRTASLVFIVASILISILLVLYSKASWRKVALVTWYLFSFSFYFYFVRDPRTHVYIAILPGLVLSGIAISEIYLLACSRKISKYLIYIVFVGSYIFLSGLYWVIYVNKSPEYPWFDKQYFGQNIYHISESNRIDGVFGFNNYRSWEKIGDLFKNGCLSVEGGFESNEKDNITFFYTGIKQKEGDRWSNENGAGTMVIVEGPHSWTYVSRREFSGYKLLDTLYTNDVPVTYIFGKNNIYPEGEYLCQK